RRHTRFSRDWSSDVCSSDCRRRPAGAVAPASARCARRNDHPGRHAAAVVAARRLRRARSGEARRARRRCVARGRGDASRRAAPRRLTAGGVIVQTFLSYGFRPFFLLAAAWAVLALVLLVVALAGGGWSAEALPLYRWHGHEMIFGFVAAAIAGFLLTAAPTWTSTRPVSGTLLAGLALLWIAGRIVASPLTGLHATPAVLVELAFFPALGAALAAPLLRTRNVRNYPFLLLLALLFAADAAFHAVLAGRLSLPFDPLRLAANIVLVMVVVVGGRIIPAFTRNALVRERISTSIRPAPLLERASLVAIAAVVVADIVAPDTLAAGIVAAAAALLIAARLARWEGWRTLRMPIVLILHVGYAWVAAALALKAVWLLAHAPWAANWLHAQT